MKNFPVITLLLTLLVGLLMALPPAVHSSLYFDREVLSQGHLRGLLSGHFIHADSQHMFWNAGALVVLGSMIEMRSRQLLAWSLAAGALSVDLLLLSPLSDIQRYCGLSGILNTLLGVTIYLQWSEHRSSTPILVGVLSLIKIVAELCYNQAIFTQISWPPYPLAHLAGILATPLAVGGYHALLSAPGEVKPKLLRRPPGVFD